jgi:hypothetical protein
LFQLVTRYHGRAEFELSLGWARIRLEPYVEPLDGAEPRLMRRLQPSAQAKARRSSLTPTFALLTISAAAASMEASVEKVGCSLADRNSCSFGRFRRMLHAFLGFRASAIPTEQADADLVVGSSGGDEEQDVGFVLLPLGVQPGSSHSNPSRPP